MRRARCLVFAATLATATAAGAAEVSVVLDQARVTQMPPEATMIIVGNPMIADATVQNGSLMVLTGKAYGTTNLMLLDSKGRTIAEHIVRVTAPRDGVVTVYRGAARESYACAPRCENTAVLGDDKDHFESVLSQNRSRNAAASGNLGPSGGNGGNSSGGSGSGR